MNKTKVWTPNGYQVGPINSLVGKGESIIDYTNGTGTLVTKGKVGVDNQPSSVKENDSNVIAGNDVDWTTGMKFSDQIAPLTAKLQMYNNIEKATGKNYNMSSLSKQTVQLQKQQIDKAKAPLLSQMKNITDRQQIQHDIQGSVENMKKYDLGKSSSYFYSRTGNGKVPNSWLTSARLIPALTETAMLSHWLSNKPKGANIYSQNTYAPLALQTLASSRISPYPMIQAAKLADRQGMYSINQSGGYTGAQRQNARIAQNLGTQRNIANILQNVEDKNIGYRNAWAQAALQAGESDAARRQSAKQYNWETYNRAHGAKTKGIETHVANLGAMWQKYWADRIKNKQYEDTLSLYKQDVDNRKLALKGLLSDNGGRNNTTGNGENNSYTKPTGQSYEMNLYQRNIQPQQNWQDKAMQNISELPLPDLPYQHTNYLDTIDWDKYFEAQKKYNKIVTGKNGIPKSSQYTFYTKLDSPQRNYLSGLIPQIIPTLPDNSKYMQTYQKYMGIPMDQLRKNYNKYLGGDIFADSKEPLGFTRMTTPSNKETILKYGFPINMDQMIRGIMLYNNNFKVPSVK